ncbi:SDR family oxidoreductase [Fulvivirgaceae bacterium BMA10]|uniref:SDR family oxidoreductase n=1 Tax=Splendidivirga corallicola TaxID=3051826 RepID=A0ABT8KV95_9BACT|nr:SDR family oxidoreductase [Fulvivirgaceae bacterium BMA10]
MKILLTGATGYIGKRMLSVLVDSGYKVVCCVRDANRFNPPRSVQDKIEILEVDFLDKNTLNRIPKDIQGAYYLIHSMSNSSKFLELEMTCAANFRQAVTNTTLQHVVYLSGIVNERSLSKHLTSRKAVEDELSKGDYNFTTLRAGIIIGSGSGSFEIIRDLVEKLPIMLAPKWLNTKCQPIGIYDVLLFLKKSIFNRKTYNKNFDIGGPDILSYKQMLLGFAEARELRRWIYTIPVMTPRLSSYWLYFITSTSFKLATALVDSMKVEVICRNDDLNQILDIIPLRYKESLQRSLLKVERDESISSWKDSFVSGRFNQRISDFHTVPIHNCFVDKRIRSIANFKKCIEKIWKIGGKSGWYYANWLWRFRGFIDKCFGGVGLRRGRTHQNHLSVGDAIDFWRVLHANKEEGRLLLFAEMKLPGEAWLEFKIINNTLYQTATFQPKGILGRIYWYFVYPLHGIVFNGLVNQLVK